jgi:CRP/FNR family transcriptional regulator, anaerobic regulatory protein
VEVVSWRSLRPWESCAVCPARRLGLCAQLAAEDIMALAEIKRRARVVSSGSLLYRQNEPCHDYIVVLAGWVALRTVLENGSRHILDFGVPGTFLGLEPAPGALMGHSAECLTDVTVCLLPRARFDHLVSSRITICSRLAKLAAAHEARAQDHLANLSGRDAHGRVAHLMAELFFRVRRKFPPLAGDVASLPLPLEQIGQATGLTAVHVSRIFRKLREEHVLRFRKPRLEILDPDALLRLAGFEGQLASWCEGSPPPTVPARRDIAANT